MVDPWHDLLTTLNDVLCLLATGHTDATAVQFSLIKGLQRALPHGQWALTHTWDGTQWQGRISVVERPPGDVTHTHRCRRCGRAFGCPVDGIPLPAHLLLRHEQERCTECWPDGPNTVPIACPEGSGMEKEVGL